MVRDKHYPFVRAVWSGNRLEVTRCKTLGDQDGIASNEGSADPYSFIIFGAPGRAIRDGVAMIAVSPAARPPRVVPGLKWGGGKNLWIDTNFRCLVGSSDLGDPRSNESLLRFKARLSVDEITGTTGLWGLIVADTANPPSQCVHVDQLDEAPWGVRSHQNAPSGVRARHGAPSLVLQSLGIRNDGEWERLRTEVRFPGDPTTMRVPQIEQRMKRTGNSVFLRHFNLEVKTGDWLRVVQRMPFEFSAEIDKLWDPARSGDNPKVSWVVELTYSEPWTPPDTPNPQVSTSRVLDAWNRNVADPHIASLRRERAGEAISVMPHFDVESAKPNYAALPDWVQLCCIQDLEPDSRIVSNQSLTIRPPTLQPLRDIKLEGSFDGLVDIHGRPTSMALVLWNRNTLDGKTLRNASMESEDQQGKFTFAAHFSLRAKGAGLRSNGDAPAICRIGALDLTLGNWAHYDSPDNGAQSFDARRSQLEAAYVGEASPLSLDATVVVPIADIVPGGQDELPSDGIDSGDLGFRVQATEQDEQLLRARFVREPPVVLSPPDPATGPSPAPNSTTSPPYGLRGHEFTSPQYSRSLALTLIETPGQNGSSDPGDSPRASQTQSLIILDRHPLLLCQVQIPPFKGAAASGSSELLEIGNWITNDTDGPHWSIRGSTNGFDFVLPPQAIGETMEKLRSGDAPATGDPYAGSDIYEGGLAEYRFSPVARFNLLASYYKQRFVEAPWNVRRLLGYPGQRAPGAGIQTLQFELLYGLTCNVTAGGLRLAELSARIGRLPGAMAFMPAWSPDNENHPLIPVYRRYRRHWADLYGRYLSRLTVLEPYSDAQSTGLLLESNVSYKLRQTADLRYPIAGGESQATNAPINANGLAGGVSWGFESVAQYNALWQTPTSTSGKVANPYFSPLGGWGYQKATFNPFGDADTIIHSNTAMGRVIYFSLEQIGRINNHYNTAKHVIVYERTVVPSAQFVPAKPGYDDQDLLLGRPILRKVREYVELIEPYREHPDSDAPLATRGFFRATDFRPNKIIAVNGKRLRDVFQGDTAVGYTIPLWHPEDQAVNPAVYPKPQVILQLTSADDPNKLTAGAISEPQKLFFYASFEKDAGPIPSKWRPWPGLDYADLPVPKPPSSTEVPAFNVDLPEATLADPVAVEPGYEMFTYNLIPLGSRANLVAERALPPGTDASAIGAVIGNITVMRAKAATAIASLTEADKKLHDEAAIVQDMAAKAREQVTSVLDAINHLSDPLSSADANRVKQAIERLKPFPPRSFPLVETLLKSRESLCAEVNRQIKAAIDRASRDAKDRVAQIATSAQNHLLGLSNQLLPRADAKHVLTLIENYIDALLDPLDMAMDQLEHILNVPPTGLSEVKKSVDAALDTAIAMVPATEASVAQCRIDITRFLADADKQFLKVRPGTPSPLGDLSKSIQGSLSQAMGDLTHAAQLLGFAKTDFDTAISTAIAALGSAPQTLAAIQTKLAALRGDFHKTIDKLEADFAARFPGLTSIPMKDLYAEIDVWCKTIDDRIDVAITSARTALDSSQICPLLFGESGTVNQYVAMMLNSGRPILQDIASLLNNPAAFDGAKALRDRVEGVRAAVIGFENGVRGAISSASAQLAQGGEKVAKPFFQTGDSALRLLRAFGDSPSVQAMEFNRKKLAYFFDEASRFVNMTPVTAFADRVANAANNVAGDVTDKLRALRLRIPTFQLLDRCIPDGLDKFDISSIVPSFSGLELGKLFSGLKLPADSNQNVKITHGFDREALRAWLKADMRVTLDQSTTLFTFGPMSVKLIGATFESHITVSAAATGAIQRQSTASLTGDWEVSLGSIKFVTFLKTSLTLENDHLKFNISPDRIKLDGVLSFIQDVIKNTGLSAGGFTINMLQLGGLPAGIQAVLNLPFPDLVSGTTGISNLLLRAGFELRLNPTNFDFALGVFFGLGRRAAPFNISFFILGGSGFLEVTTLYSPRSGKISVAVALSIAVSASLAFALGPIKGMVYVGVGITADFYAESGAPATLAIGAQLLILGQVDCAGLISVTISLLLTIQYVMGPEGNSLVARGTLSISVKICWCFTFSFSATVEYAFHTSGSDSKAISAAPSNRGLSVPGVAGLFDGVLATGNETEPTTYRDAATQYLDLMEGMPAN